MSEVINSFKVDKYLLLELSEFEDSNPELREKIKRYERLISELNTGKYKKSAYYCRKTEVQSLHEQLTNYKKHRMFHVDL